MSKAVKVTLLISIGFILLSILSFALVVKFYPPLRYSLFGGEYAISQDDIQFWVNKVGSYYRIYARYLKCPIVQPDYGHLIFFRDKKDSSGLDIFFNPDDGKIYGGGLRGEKELTWELYYLGSGKINNSGFKPNFLQGSKFTFYSGGSLVISDAPAYYITIYLPGIVKKIEKLGISSSILAEIIKNEDLTKRNQKDND